MESLGFVETKGYVPAFACADAMLKSADVKIVKKVWVGAAYVTTIISGNIGAVRTAVDAGATAANITNSLYSCHAIPMPDEDFLKLIMAEERV